MFFENTKNKLQWGAMLSSELGRIKFVLCIACQKNRVRYLTVVK